MNAEEVWQNYLNRFKEYITARMAFYANTSPETRLTIVKKALQTPSELPTALAYMQSLFEYTPNINIEGIKDIICDVLGIASMPHEQASFAQTLILSLPHEWLLENIESCTEKILEGAGYEEYRAILALYNEIDVNLARKLAQRAAQSEEADIRDVGEIYLEKLGGTTQTPPPTE